MKWARRETEQILNLALRTHEKSGISIQQQCVPGAKERNSFNSQASFHSRCTYCCRGVGDRSTAPWTPVQYFWYKFLFLTRAHVNTQRESVCTAVKPYKGHISRVINIPSSPCLPLGGIVFFVQYIFTHAQVDTQRERESACTAKPYKGHISRVINMPSSPALFHWVA